MKNTTVLDNGITVTTEPQSDEHITHTYRVPIDMIDLAEHKVILPHPEIEDDDDDDNDDLSDVDWNHIDIVLHEFPRESSGSNYMVRVDDSACTNCGCKVMWHVDFNKDSHGVLSWDKFSIRFFNYATMSFESPLPVCQNANDPAMEMDIEVGSRGLLIGNDLRSSSDPKNEEGVFDVDSMDNGLDINSNKGMRNYIQRMHNEVRVVNIPATNCSVDVYRHPDGSLGFYMIDPDDLEDFREDGESEWIPNLTSDHVLFKSKHIGGVSCGLWAVMVTDYENYVDTLGGQTVEEYDEHRSRWIVERPEGATSAHVTIHSAASDYDPHDNAPRFFNEPEQDFSLPLATLTWH